jgi:ABC-type amino acid transport substrate-binding protein
MKKKMIFKSVLIIFVMMVFWVSCNQTGQQNGPHKESVYDRVMQTGIIRAGYITYPPALMKDTTTGKMSGIFVETLEQMAKNMGLEVKWTEEVGWGAQIEGLNADRYDIVGSPVWANPTRGKLTTMSIPVYFSGIGIYVRKDDNRFTNDWSLINKKEIRISTIDGETADLIARTQFPEARRVSLPQLTDISRMFLEVATNKTDVCFAEPFYGYKYIENNPGSVKNIADITPVKVLGNCYMFKKGEFEFKQALDVAIQDLLNSGFVDNLLDKYEPYPNTFYRVAHPYRVVQVNK